MGSTPQEATLNMAFSRYYLLFSEMTLKDFVVVQGMHVPTPAQAIV
jgi:hypothetical protein